MSTTSCTTISPPEAFKRVIVRLRLLSTLKLDECSKKTTWHLLNHQPNIPEPNTLDNVQPLELSRVPKQYRNLCYLLGVLWQSWRTLYRTGSRMSRGKRNLKLEGVNRA